MQPSFSGQAHSQRENTRVLKCEVPREEKVLPCDGENENHNSAQSVFAPPRSFITFQILTSSEKMAVRRAWENM